MEALKSRLVDSKWFFPDLEHVQTKCNTAGMFLTALSTFTKSATAMYSEQGMSQSRIIWGGSRQERFPWTEAAEKQVMATVLCTSEIQTFFLTGMEVTNFSQ